jgi:hypothetical protein
VRERERKGERGRNREKGRERERETYITVIFWNIVRYNFFWPGQVLKKNSATGTRSAKG